MQPATATPMDTAQQRVAASPQSPVPSGAPAPGPFRGTLRQYREAQRRARLVAEYEALMLEGILAGDAAQILRAAGEQCSRSSLDRWRGALSLAGFAGLLDHRDRSGRKRERLVLSETEERLVRARVLATTNRTRDSGSVPEALRQAARRGEIGPELVAEFRQRERDGRGIPDALRRDLTPSAAVVQQLRSPTDAALDFLTAPGSLMWTRDSWDGPERPVRVGDILEADDATVNFPVVVPWEIGGCPCSDKYGVKVARFQWLVAIDRGSRFVPGWSYVMRSRSSYRKEDILRLFHALFRQHGMWRILCLERATWESHAVSAMLAGLGIDRQTAWSPHQKPFIEGLFDSTWTKLAYLPGQVGRFAGDEEATDSLMRSCQEGATDPRNHFVSLAAASLAFDEVLAERNQTPVNSPNYGRWVPEERWLAQLDEARERRRLRPLPAETAWLFAPEMREWTIGGGSVGGSVQIMEGCSVRYDFAAPWLPQYDGARVRVHFDPAGAPEATLVLQENVRDVRAGTVLGVAVQTNKVARYARRVLGWANDPDLGLEMRKAQASAMRAEVRTILPGGGTGLSVTRLRDGEDRVLTIERGGDSAQRDGAASTPALATEPVTVGDGREPSPAVHRRAVNPLRPSSPEEFRRRATLAAELAASARADEE